MPFEKGNNANPRGRPKGSKNKQTAELKDAILAAANGAHPEGLVGYLTWLAQEQPTAFAPLLGKLLPRDVSVDLGGTLLIVKDYSGGAAQ